jgi:Flp pilus assembly protein TadD
MKMEIRSLEAALRANRAMALLKLQDYDQAEQETHLALQLDPHNLKGKQNILYSSRSCCCWIMIVIY